MLFRSQLYHDYKRGIKAGYAKYETFPIWNLSLNHPVNIAYEAATADLNDMNMIDPWHLSAYNEVSVNYNRDVEIFPVLHALFEKLMGKSPYASPTDMGVNMVGYAISDNEVCEEAAKQEVIRRYFKAKVGVRKGLSEQREMDEIGLLMERMNVHESDRAVVEAARKVQERTNGAPAAAIELPNGKMITGKTSDLLGCSSAMLLNALKELAGIDSDVELISPSAIQPIQRLKLQLGGVNPRLHTDEMLIALSITASRSKLAGLSLAQLPKLAGCEVHTTTILSPVDEKMFRKLGVNLTSDAVYSTKKLVNL